LKAMSDKRDNELIQAVKKLQWALGESVFRTEKLRKIVYSQDDQIPGFRLYLNELHRALSDITQLYRHNIADKIVSNKRS
jgi:hypothetical protein